MTPSPMVFQVDVDNRFLDNDRIQNDLMHQLEREFGSASRATYWTIVEQLFTDLGYRDYIGALQRYQAEHPQDLHLCFPFRHTWVDSSRQSSLPGAASVSRAPRPPKPSETGEASMKVLVIDVGGTHVKIIATGQKQCRKFPSGPTLTPKQMVAGVKKLAADWGYDAVSIGYPGPIIHNRPLTEPYNLGRGWMGFDFRAAFKRRVKIVNDAAMQAIGSYKGGKMLFLGLGTGLGSTMIVDGIVEPMELGHLPYKKGTYEDYVGIRGLQRGKKKWRLNVADVVSRLVAALEPDDVVIGGGNVKKLKKLPKGCRRGDNANAFRGGFRLWEISARPRSISLQNTETQKGVKKENDQKNRAP